MTFAINFISFYLACSNKFRKYSDKVLAIERETDNVAFAFKRARDRGIWAMQAAHGVTGKRKFALAALLSFFLFAGFLATAQRARADTGSPDPSTAGEVAAPPAQDASTTPQTATDQQSTTDQTASPTATAQPQQSNVVIIIRVNSPGDDVVTQTNIVSVVAVGSNQSSTSQNSGLPGPFPAGTDANSGSPDPSGTDGQPTDVQPTESQAAPVPGAAPQRSQPAPPQAPAPAQAPSGARAAAQPAQAVAVAPQRPAALAVLASSANVTANREAPRSQGGSPTTSATHLRRGGARGRSDASASRPPVGVQAGGFAAKPTSTGKAGGEAKSANVDVSIAGASTIAAKDARGSWFDPARLAPPTPIAANDSGSGPNLGLVTTLTALLASLIGWRLLTWFGTRGWPWRRAGG